MASNPGFVTGQRLLAAVLDAAFAGKADEAEIIAEAAARDAAIAAETLARVNAIVAEAAARTAAIATTTNALIAAQQVAALGAATLDFSAGVDPAVWTFTRASITFEYAAGGAAAFLASGVPAVRFDPSSGTYAGLSIYDAATNLQPNLQAVVSNAPLPFFVSGVTAAQVVANAPTASPPGFGPVGSTFIPISAYFGAPVTVTEDTVSSGSHTFYTLMTAANATTYAVGCHLEAGTRAMAQLRMDQITSLVGGGTLASAEFDLGAGTIHSTSGANVTATMTPTGNGWYWCLIVATTVVGGGAGRAMILGYNGTTTTYLGTGAAFNVFGAHKSRCAIGAMFGVSGAAGPAGSPAPQLAAMTSVYDYATGAATAVIEDTSAAAMHGFVNPNIAAADATSYTWAGYLLAGTRTQVQLQIDGIASLAGGGTAAWVAFDLVAGTVIATSGANVVAFIEYAGAGYWRCAITTTTVVGGGGGRALIVGYNSGATYNGAGATFYVWGILLSATAYVPPYIGPTSLPTTEIDTRLALLVATEILGVVTTTRAADAIVMAGAAFTANIGAGAFLLGCNVVVPQAAATADQTIWQADDGTDANRIALVVRAGSLAVTLLVVVASVPTYVLGGRVLTAGAVTGIVVEKTGTNVLSMFVNGVIPASKTMTLPTPTALRLGNNVAGTAPMNGRILSISAKPAATTDTLANAASVVQPRIVPVYGSDPDWTMVVLPDTQNAVSYVPAAWVALYNWIIAQKAALNIKLVFSVGDVTDDAAAPAMAVGRIGFEAMNAAGIPSMPNIGNHDYDLALSTNVLRTNPAYQAAFSPAWFAQYAWFGGSYLGTTENWWGKITLASTTYLVLCLENFPRAAVIVWAQGILDLNASMPCIFFTHSFIYVDGNLVTAATPNAVASYSGPVGLDGQAVWDGLVKLNRNIVMAFCGHHIGPAYCAYNPMVGTHGNIVHTLFTNHQQELTNGQPLNTVGGGARATLLTFKPSIGRVELSCYDPAAAAFNPLDVREWRYSA